MGYGIEVEVYCPISVFISKIEIINNDTGEVHFPDLPEGESSDFSWQIGASMEKESLGLAQVIKLILNYIQKTESRVFKEIYEIAEMIIRERGRSSTRLKLNRSTINLKLEDASTPKFISDNTAMLQKIKFSTDLGASSSSICVVPELVTYPVGRFNGRDLEILQNQEKFLEDFFKFVDDLANVRQELKISCSINWFQPSTWLTKDQNGKLWNYKINISGNLSYWGNAEKAGYFPQYNTAVDTTQFLGNAHHGIQMETYNTLPTLDEAMRAHFPDNFLCLLLLNVESNELLSWNMTLLNLSRSIVREMSFEFPHTALQLHRFWIDGSFIFTIWYFFSLCIGFTERNALCKNLWLIMPKTSPIPFLIAACKADSKYYHLMLQNFFPAVKKAIYGANLSSNDKKNFLLFLKMSNFFPRIARWYAPDSGIILGMENSITGLSLTPYKNPLPFGVSEKVTFLHKIFFESSQNDFPDPANVSSERVLYVLLKLIYGSFVGGAGEDLRKRLESSDPSFVNTILVSGSLLTVTRTNAIAVGDFPGVGRAKFEVRGAKKPNADLISRLPNLFNQLSKSQIRLPPQHSLIDNADQQSLDLTISNLGHRNTDDPDPWKSNEDYQDVWIPTVIRFEHGRRNEDHVRKWLEQVARSKGGDAGGAADGATDGSVDEAAAPTTPPPATSFGPPSPPSSAATGVTTASPTHFTRPNLIKTPWRLHSLSRTDIDRIIAYFQGTLPQP